MNAKIMTIDTEDYEVFDTNAYSNYQPFRGLVQRKHEDGTTSWEFGHLGNIANLRYQNPLDSEKQGPNDRVFLAGDKSYSLSGSKSSVVDQQTILEPLLNMGWEVGSHQTLRGGIRFVTTLTHPTQTIEDFIHWDHELLSDITRDSSQLILKPAITIRANLQTSTQIHVTAGFFRLVCLNGLTAKVLDMGHLSLNGRNFNHKALEDMGRRTSADSFHQDTLRQLPAPAIGSIGRLIAQEENSGLPRLIAEPLSRIVGTLSNKDRQALGRYFQAIQESGQDRITVMDLLSAITSATKNIRVLDRLDPLTQDLSDLVELQSFSWK